jgi:hypothetical protein
VANARTIAGALATTEAGLVVLDSRAVRVCDGRIVSLSRDALLHVVNQYIVTPVVVDRGKADGGVRIEYHPAVVPYLEDTLRALMTGRSREEGGLIHYLPKARVLEPVG